MIRKRVVDVIGKAQNTELPRQGVSGTGGDEDGDAGSFLPPACLGYRHHFGGWKTPPPTVPPM